MPDNQIDPLAPFNEAPEDIKRIIRKVLNFEKDRLYKKRVHKYNEEISTIVKEEIK